MIDAEIISTFPHALHISLDSKFETVKISRTTGTICYCYSYFSTGLFWEHSVLDASETESQAIDENIVPKLAA